MKDWWDQRPVFSTTDKGGRITGLAPGESPGQVTPRLVTSAAVCFGAWGAASSLGTSWLCNASSAPAETCAVDLPSGVPVIWRVVATVVVAYLLLTLTLNFGEQARQRLGQRRAASLVRATAVLAGIAAGAGFSVVTGFAPDRAGTLQRTLDGRIGTEAYALSAALTLIAAVWWVTVVGRLPSALVHAQQRQATIERLRRDGRRYAGTVRLGGIVFWLGNSPELNVTIAYDSPAGTHELAARMRTSPDRVPADGSRVLVFDDLRGVVHVELDLDAAPTFEPEARCTPAE
ncbi:hypothetical protein [Kribbella sp.]|uniref:hypothetical protein n=1 Tax=Kribbella sp. TaxID=1871183 RepID=UPI002D5535E6|nr:hypothetical protein [Kribbella sp.]HZX02709.1 hypothetical protein [Kribbella sp.]